MRAHERTHALHPLPPPPPSPQHIHTHTHTALTVVNGSSRTGEELASALALAAAGLDEPQPLISPSCSLSGAFAKGAAFSRPSRHGIAQAALRPGTASCYLLRSVRRFFFWTYILDLWCSCVRFAAIKYALSSPVWKDAVSAGCLEKEIQEFQNAKKKKVNMNKSICMY